MIGFNKNKPPKHVHDWEKWSDIKTSETRNSFSSSRINFQTRVCKDCGFIDDRTINEVYSR